MQTRADAAAAIVERLTASSLKLITKSCDQSVHPDMREIYSAAARGAARYSNHLRSILKVNQFTDLTLVQADLVAIAAECGGYLSRTGAPAGRDAAVQALLDEGYFVQQAAVPGVWAAHYRLVG